MVIPAKRKRNTGAAASPINSARSQTKLNSKKELLVQRKRNTGASSPINSGKAKLKSEKEILVHRRVELLDQSGNTPVDEEDDENAHTKVKNTLRLFNKHYLQCIQKETNRCAKPEVVEDSPKRKRNVKKVQEKIEKRKSSRPDLKAVTCMRENNEILYPKKKWGTIPGVDVGHQFYSKAEMVAIGFHSHWLNGIDYMGQDYAKKKEYRGYKFPLAVALVMSGMYEDDKDDSKDVIYTGQGGHDLLGNKKQNKDQVLEKGNLALKNCIDQGVPVRVVRGHTSAGSYTKKVYTYDGLYKVVKCWEEKGVAGFKVFKYKLQRLQGQPALISNKVHFAYKSRGKSVPKLPGLICKDISGGLEKIPIPAINEVDDLPVPDFTYTASMIVSNNIELPANVVGCKCNGKTCGNPKTCSCTRLNDSDLPYVECGRNKSPDIRLIEAKDVIYECGPTCGCGPDCLNRASQRGIRFHLEVFRTTKKGWGVRSRNIIPSGAPICEYIGVLKKAVDVDNVASDNSYIFDIDCLQTMRGLDGRERRLQDASVKSPEPEDEIPDEPEYCIDAGSSGNVARFINHSCEPNLFIQCVLSTHHDMRLARVMLFAADTIPPMQELTYDYGYALDSVLGSNGKVKQMACHCGEKCCRKRLY